MQVARCLPVRTYSRSALQLVPQPHGVALNRITASDTRKDSYPPLIEVGTY